MSFARHLLPILSQSGVGEQLTRGRRVVVLERLARGGGETHWYLLRSESDLQQLAEALRPSSDVWFFFGDEFVVMAAGDALWARVRQLVGLAGEVLLARERTENIELDVWSVAGPIELQEAASEIADGELTLVGPYPAPFSGATAGPRLSLPDRDGVLRAHPH